MNKDFSIIALQQKIEKPWGYELILTPSDVKVTGKIVHINAGCRISLQYHDLKEEMLTLVNGKAIVILEDGEGKIQEIMMEPLKGYFVKPFQKHRVKAVTDVDIFEASTKEEGNTVRLEDDYRRDTETEEDRNLPNRGWNRTGK